MGPVPGYLTSNLVSPLHGSVVDADCRMTWNTSLQAWALEPLSLGQG